VDHRHLLPDEIDLLLDGEEGFGVAPLRSHVEQCAQCRAELDSQRRLVTSLERLPHFTPTPLFAERVMTHVVVFEPWHVAWRDALRRWLPQSQVSRAIVASTAGVMAVTVTLLAVWLARRADAALFVANLAVHRVRDGLLDVVHASLVATMGQPTAALVQANGAIGLAVVGTGTIAAIMGLAFGLRSLTAVARRRRS
jgi:hypothetical protein